MIIMITLPIGNCKINNYFKCRNCKSQTLLGICKYSDSGMKTSYYCPKCNFELKYDDCKWILLKSIKCRKCGRNDEIGIEDKLTTNIPKVINNLIYDLKFFMNRKLCPNCFVFCRVENCSKNSEQDELCEIKKYDKGSDYNHTLYYCKEHYNEEKAKLSQKKSQTSKFKLTNLFR